MIKLSGKIPKTLKTICLTLGVIAASLTISACPICGVTESESRDDIIRVRGQVRAEETGERINGIVVFIKELNGLITTQTRGTVHGTFEFWIIHEHNRHDYYTLTFTDIDLDANGGDFMQKTLLLTWEEAKASMEAPLIIYLELK